MSAKKFPIPEKYIELLFGVGASVVIIGALMKITHFNSEFISGNSMLTIGLVTEAVIFLVAGVRGYFLTAEDSSSAKEGGAIANIASETEALKAAFIETTAGLNDLKLNVKRASDSAGEFKSTDEISQNITVYNSALVEASSKLQQVSDLYNDVHNSFKGQPGVNKALESSSQDLQVELSKMKESVEELNAKYAAVLQAMNK